jgi:hypothetical protein
VPFFSQWTIVDLFRHHNLNRVHSNALSVGQFVAHAVCHVDAGFTRGSPGELVQRPTDLTRAEML